MRTSCGSHCKIWSLNLNGGICWVERHICTHTYRKRRALQLSPLQWREKGEKCLNNHAAYGRTKAKSFLKHILYRRGKEGECFHYLCQLNCSPTTFLARDSGSTWVEIRPTYGSVHVIRAAKLDTPQCFKTMCVRKTLSWVLSEIPIVSAIQERGENELCGERH